MTRLWYTGLFVGLEKLLNNLPKDDLGLRDTIRAQGTARANAWTGGSTHEDKSKPVSGTHDSKVAPQLPKIPDYGAMNTADFAKKIGVDLGAEKEVTRTMSPGGTGISRGKPIKRTQEFARRPKRTEAAKPKGLTIRGLFGDAQNGDDGE